MGHGVDPGLYQYVGSDFKLLPSLHLTLAVCALNLGFKINHKYGFSQKEVFHRIHISVCFGRTQTSRRFVPMAYCVERNGSVVECLARVRRVAGSRGVLK